MTLNQKLENTHGTLRCAYKQCVPGTIFCVDQLINERRTDPDLRKLWVYAPNEHHPYNEGINPKLRDRWFYTADGEVYFMERGTPMLAITREATNPILKNIDVPFEQFVNNDNYQVTPADFEAVRTASDTVIIDLTKLRLQDNRLPGTPHSFIAGAICKWFYLTINTKNYDKQLNEEERKLAERIYGQGEDFVANMKMMKDANWGKVEIYVLNPDYVQQEAKDNPIGRCSHLNYFHFNSDWTLGIKDHIDYRFRGVRQESEANRKKKVSLSLDEILACFKHSSIHRFDEEVIRDLFLP